MLKTPLKMGYKVGIMGLGSIGFRHLQNLLNERSDIDQIFVHDVSEKSALEKINSLADDRTNFVNTKDELLKQDVDIAFVCTPSESHFRDSYDYVTSGIPIFIEKPVTVKNEDCQKLLEAKKSHIFVGCNMRYHPAVKSAKKIIETQRIGSIVAANAFFGHNLANWRPGTDYKKTYSADSSLGGGVLFDGIHELDYLIWLFGPVEKYASFFTNSNILGIKAEETAKVIFKHENGVLSDIHLDYIQPLKKRGLEIIGSEGAFIWNSLGKNPEKMEIKIVTKDEEELLSVDGQNNANAPYVEELNEIFSVLSGKDVASTDLLTIELASEEIEIIENMKMNNG